MTLCDKKFAVSGELAANIGANVIQSTPWTYLRGLIVRARAGTFTPEGALQIAELRKRRAEVETAIKRNEDMGSDNPFPRALAAVPVRRRKYASDRKNQISHANMDQVASAST